MAGWTDWVRVETLQLEMKSSSAVAPLLSPLLSAALITNTNTTAWHLCWCRVAVCVYSSFVCVCVCVRACVSTDAPFARVVVGECQRPMGGSQRAEAARATAATQAASLLTRRSGSERAPGGGRPRLHSFKQQASRWNIDVTAAHTVLPVSHMYRTCVTHTVDLFSRPCCWYRGSADLWILWDNTTRSRQTMCWEKTGNDLSPFWGKKKKKKSQTFVLATSPLNISVLFCSKFSIFMFGLLVRQN